MRIKIKRSRAQSSIFGCFSGKNADIKISVDKLFSGEGKNSALRLTKKLKVGQSLLCGKKLNFINSTMQNFAFGIYEIFLRFLHRAILNIFFCARLRRLITRKRALKFEIESVRIESELYLNSFVDFSKFLPKMF